MNIPQGLLPFQLIEDSTNVLITSFGGLPPVMETFRALGLPQSIPKHLLLQKRPGKYEEADYVESFISVLAAGGDCFDDFQLLHQDPALQKLGLKVPSPESARFFGNAFHEEEKLRARVPQEAFLPEETTWLQGLEKVNRNLVHKATLGKAPWQATIDIDATVIESDKQEALYTYLGYRGYQPVIAYWVEPDLSSTFPLSRAKAMMKSGQRSRINAFLKGKRELSLR
jgi:predicted secreted acid phosphatase